jgi:site-specific recombinase XerC
MARIQLGSFLSSSFGTMDIFTVSKLLGHANVKTTRIVAHLAPNHRAAEMERYQQYLAAG